VQQFIQFYESAFFHNQKFRGYNANAHTLTRDLTEITNQPRSSPVSLNAECRLNDSQLFQSISCKRLPTGEDCLAKEV